MSQDADPFVRLEVGARPVADYVLTKRIANGTFGEVWQACGPRDVPCALKFVRFGANDADQEARARLEVRALDLMKQFGHPHLVRIFGAWERDGYLVVAMELAEDTLKQRLETAVKQGHKGIPAPELLKYMTEAAEALDFLNFEKKIQHRDIKPLNILIKSGSVLVADYGLAKFLEHTQASHTGGMTIAYAPPEFFEDRATRWSDQYSLAVSYCQLRGNRLPFTGNANKVMKGHMEGEPDLTMLPEEERPVVARALIKDPTKRYKNCDAFVEALKQALPVLPASPIAGSAGPVVEAPVELLTTVLPATPVVAAPSLDFQFVRLPAATFWMSKDGKNAQHQEAIPHDFEIGIYPLTQGQWQAVMGNNPSWFSRTGGGKDKVKAISDDDLRHFPVESVSWNDVQEFLKRLNQKIAKGEGLYRLPTEAEWEYSCRGGATSKTDCSFDFYVGDGPSNDLSSQDANFDGRRPAGKAVEGPYLERTSKVGLYRPNRLGIFDMHGNDWEWCDDLWVKGSGRVVRGGSWGSSGRRCAAADRHGLAPEDANQSSGFRLARSPSGS